MSLQEVKESDEQVRIGRAGPKLVSPDSGQVEQSLRPPWFIERCGQRS